MTPTPRQIEVLDAVIEHDGDRDAAAKALFLSPRTVKSHLRNLYDRLDIQPSPRSPRSLIAAARRTGRITPRGER